MVRNGVLAAGGLFALYALPMTVLNGWDATIGQFRALWYLMVPLAVGFGIQVGLYTRFSRGRTTVTAGGLSGGAAMLACCAHHATDVLPIVGLSAISMIIAGYQVPILLTSLAINAVGILFLIISLSKEKEAVQPSSSQRQ